MTYNVFGGMLKPTPLPTSQSSGKLLIHARPECVINIVCILKCQESKVLRPITKMMTSDSDDVHMFTSTTFCSKVKAR